MKKNRIPRRTSVQTQKILFARKPLSYSKLDHPTTTQKNLQLAGLMLYWAEGSKSGTATVDFANSNQEMASIFLKMLRRIYCVNEARLRIFLYCYANQNPNQLIEHWSNYLGIPQTQFTKPYIRSDYDEKKSDKMALGLIHIRYGDTRLKAQILKDIAHLSNKFCRDGGVDNHTSL